MALTEQTQHYIDSLDTLRLVDVRPGPPGPHGVESHWLVPVHGYHKGQRFPHDVKEDLEAQNFEKVTHEGLEYYLVPEVSTNVPGRLSHYAQLTGPADLANPPGGGVNRARETFVDNSTDATVAPDHVRKYVDKLDTWEEARKKKSEENERVQRQVTKSPAREPAAGKLVHTDDEKGPKEVKKGSKSVEPETSGE